MESRESAGRLWAVACLLCAASLALPGCGGQMTENLVREGIAGPAAPEWVHGKVQNPDMPDEVFFVGRSTCTTVVDEGAALRAAREDAYKQIADYVTTRATGRSYLAGCEFQRLIEREAALFTCGIAGELVDRDVYFEAWELLEDPPPWLGEPERTALGYKCWLLVSIPREKLDRRVEEFRSIAQDTYERFMEDRERAIVWAENDRQRRIRREEQDRAWAMRDHEEDREEARGYRHQIMRTRTNVVYRVESAN